MPEVLRGWLAAGVPLGWWPLALLLVGLAQCLLLWRCRLCLAWLGAAPPWRALLLLYVQGWAFLLTPARSGEVVRVALLRRRCGIPHAVALAGFLAERCTGLAAALLVLALGLSGLRLWPMLVLAASLAFVVFGLTHPASLALVQRRLVGHPGRWRRWLTRSLAALVHLRALLSPRQFLIGVALALGAWLLEASLVWSLWQVIGASPAAAGPGLLQAAVVRVSLGLGAVLSMLPAGIGVADGTALGVALLYGIKLPVAITTLVVLRVCTIGLPLAVGGLAWLIPPLNTAQDPTP